MAPFSHIAAGCGRAVLILSLGGCASDSGHLEADYGSVAPDRCVPQRSYKHGYAVETIIIDPTCPLGYTGIMAGHHSRMLFPHMVRHP